MLKRIFQIIIILAFVVWVSGYGVFIANLAIKFTPSSYDTLEKTDAVIVLTGGNNRVKTGLELLAAGISDNLFITGVNKSVRKKDIIAMWKGRGKLPDCCITLGHEATTTIENAIEAKEWIKSNNIRSVRLVTSAYHMERALLEFRNIIKDVDILAHPVVEADNQQLQALNFWKITFSEYNKVLFRYVVLYMTNKKIE